MPCPWHYSPVPCSVGSGFARATDDGASTTPRFPEDFGKGKFVSIERRCVDQDLPDTIDRNVRKVVADIRQISVAGEGTRNAPRPPLAKGLNIALARNCWALKTL